MRRRFMIGLDEVQFLAAATLAEAQRQGLGVSIAIVDEGGHPLHLTRMDEAKVTTADAAMRKARTAALTRGPTRALEERLATMPSLFFLDNLPMQGGMPILHEGECVGGLGVSGARPDQDEALAVAALAALTAKG